MTKFLDSFSEEIWNSTYRHHSDTTIDDTLKRVSSAIASVETTEELKKQWADNFYDMLSDFKVVPGGRIIVNAGTEWHGSSLINCFVSPTVSNPDSIDGIYHLLRDQAKTLKSEGGWGHNFCLGSDEEILVKRENIEMYIPISAVAIGDLVLSADKNWHIVEEVLVSERENMIELTFDNNTTLICTDDHPFLVERSGQRCWVEAKDILDTDILVTV
jgi:ribonucleotide reductase alpha subunit